MWSELLYIMIPIRCIECVHCLDKVSDWCGTYYPRNCGEGMTHDASCFCPKTFPEFRDTSKKLVVCRSSRSIIVDDSQLSIF